MRIEAMSAERAEDWLAFFDGVGFVDNPAWSGCYCRVFTFPHETEDYMEACTSGANRSVMAEAAARGEVQGFLAYADEVDGKPVGWCRAELRAPLRGGHSGIQARDAAEDESVLATVCFVIAPSHRRKGLARALLTAACESARARGLRAVEGYALKELPEAAPGVPDEAELFRGPRGLFEKLGFSAVAETERYDVMRLDL